MANENNSKNFSESKTSNSIKKCRLCKEAIPKLALGFSNQAAIKAGWCSWVCMLSAIGTDRAYAILEDKAKENREERKHHP